MFIPRENGLTRIGVHLDISDPSLITPEEVVARVNRIIYPYTVECLHVHWHAVFRSNRRSSNHIAKFNRVFLAGDAVHTHSPKAGIGMNFSLQDSKFLYSYKFC